MCVHHIFTFQTARRASLIAPGKARLPAAVQSCPPRKYEVVKRRQALVRNAAPVAALRLGQSLHRKGLPAHDAGRRALRRFTTAFHEALPHLLSGRAFLPGLLTRSPGSPAGSLRTGHLVPVGRGPRPPGSPADEAGRAGTPLPAPPIERHRLTPSNERGYGPRYWEFKWCQPRGQNAGTGPGGQRRTALPRLRRCCSMVAR
jgi:hypothetical protein